MNLNDIPREWQLIIAFLLGVWAAGFFEWVEGVRRDRRKD